MQKETVNSVAQHVSIAMATYNGGEYLADQLASFAQQTRLPDELIICDDRSTDGTVEVLETFRANAPFPVQIVVNETNLGYSANFSKAVSLCKGDIIFFSDQDDIWLPEKVVETLSYMDRTGSLAVTHDCSIRYDNTGETLPSYHEYNAQSGLPLEYSVYGCCMAFHRTLMERVGWPGYANPTGHDRWVLFAAILRGRRGCLDTPLMIRRVHGRNVSGVTGGGPGRLRKFARGLKLPFFTSDDDVDFFVTHWYCGPGYAELKDMVETLRPEIPAARADRAIKAMQRKEIMRAFVNGPLYARRGARMSKALKLFFVDRAYRSGDGIFGLLLDITGRRVGMD